MLLPRRTLAVVPERAKAVAGGACPAYERVIALDRSRTQLAERGAGQGARIFQRHLDRRRTAGPEVTEAVGKPGSRRRLAVHCCIHSPQTGMLVDTLARLLAPGGSLIVIDYRRHEDESMRNAADIWLGFSPTIEAISGAAGLEKVQVAPLPSALIASGRIITCRAGARRKQRTRQSGKPAEENHADNYKVRDINCRLGSQEYVSPIEMRGSWPAPRIRANQAARGARIAGCST